MAILQRFAGPRSRRFLYHWWSEERQKRAAGGGVLAAPVNTAVPTISGTEISGQTLTATTGTWTGNPTPTYGYQWQDDVAGNAVYSNIGGATSSTYVLAAGQVGDKVRVVVTATNSEGAASANSAASGIIAAAGSLLLDLIATTPTGAYSTRKISAAYAGSCMRVRRESDSTEQDIGFSSDDLDTTALLAFTGTTGADYGYIVTWYDQSGNARNMTQATAGEQPHIVFSGAVTTMNSLPSAFLSIAHVVGAAASNFISASAYTAFSIFRPLVMESDNGPGYGNKAVVGDAGGYFWQSLGTDRLLCGHYDAAEIASNPTTPVLVVDTDHVGVSRFASGTLVGMLDGNDAATAASTDIDDLTGLMNIGRGGSAASIQAYISEVLFFNVGLSDANINTLGNAMATRAGSTWTTYP